YPQLAEAIGAAGSAEAHWRQIGATSGLNPTAWFDEAWYLQANPDVQASVARGETPSGFQHWLAQGAAELRSPSPGIDMAGLPGTPEETPLARFRRRLARQAKPARLPAKAPKPLVDPILARLTATPGAALHDAYLSRLLADLALVAPTTAQRLKPLLGANEQVIASMALDAAPSSEPLVSIIMPSFNRGFLIAEAIQSVLDQTWSNWELIVCDDGSTDKTPFVVERFVDPRIRYLRLEKTNGAIARNHGLRFARGRYIAFLDSDNLWHPLFLAASVGRLHQSGAAWLYSGFLDNRMLGARFAEAELKNRPFDYQALLARNYIDLNAIVIDRAVYD
ncbi:MAG: glycosyltransferase family 2 protein, partial [Brevundimonas sp.]